MQRVIWGGAVILWLVSVSGLAGGVVWQADLLGNHFRVQLLIVSAAFAAFAVVFGGRAALAAFCVLALNIILVSGRMVDMAGPPVKAEGVPVRILSLNLQLENRAHQSVNDLIGAEDADIVVLTEYSPRWATGLNPAQSAYPFVHLRPRSNYHGMAVFSKTPFSADEIQASHFNDEIVTVRAEFEQFTLYAVHPSAPVMKKLAFDNYVYLEKVAHLAVEDETPVIVAGDFNATPWSRAFGPLAKAGLMRSHVSPFAQTFPHGHRLKGIEIDHILVKNVEAAQSKVNCTDVGSDHCAVTGEVWVGTPDKSRASAATSD